MYVPVHASKVGGLFACNFEHIFLDAAFAAVSNSMIHWVQLEHSIILKTKRKCMQFNTIVTLEMF